MQTCAQEVANAFIADPAEPPNTACFADLAPDWVLPS